MVKRICVLLAVMLCVSAVPAALAEDDEPQKVGTRANLIKLLEDMNGVYDVENTRDIAVPDKVMGTPAPEAASAVARDMGGGAAGTNVQVQGVDEGDIVKLDGEYIYTATRWDGIVSIVRADGKNLTKVSEIKTPENTGFNEMYISGDRLILTYYKYGTGKMFTCFAVYDISDRKNPKEFRTVEVTGSSLSTRLIDNVLYFAVNHHLYVQRLNGRIDDDQLYAEVHDSSVSQQSRAVEPQDILYFPGPIKSASYLLVGAFDVTTKEPSSVQTYLGAGTQLYANATTMMITRQDWNANWTQAQTKLFRFVIDGTDITYTGRAQVNGSLASQYACDEYNGFFRIATTDRDAGSFVTVFDQDMKQVGQTSALAPGESIQSVRFMGDTGYIVTFEKVDPLFVLDLSDPAKPVVLGELKVPGFSTYLHPVGDDLLVGIGRHMMDTYVRHEDGNEQIVGIRDMGLKISLFDVSDPYKPAELDKLILDENSYSETNWNPRALMVDAERKQFGLDYTYYEEEDTWRGGLVVRVTEERKLEVAARMQLPNDYNEMRLRATDDTLYIAGGIGIQAYDYNTFQKTGEINLGTKEYPRAVPFK